MKIHALSAYAIQIGLESTAQVADNMTVCWREIQESSSKAAFLSIMKKLAVPLIITAVSIGIIFTNKIFFSNVGHLYNVMIAVTCYAGLNKIMLTLKWRNFLPTLC